MALRPVFAQPRGLAVWLVGFAVLALPARAQTPAEVFSPPYLFKGARPTLSSAPSTVMPGTTFSVATPDAARIRKVTLIALGSVTHTFDENQRLLTLPFTPGTGGLTVTAPTFNSRAPPGYYQLFLVNDVGVPSVGRMVRVLRRTTSTAAGALQEE